MKFEQAVELLKQGCSLYHPSMQDGTYFTYTADLNIYHHIGLPKGLILDAMVFFETYGKQQFDSMWIIDGLHTSQETFDNLKAY